MKDLVLWILYGIFWMVVGIGIGHETQPKQPDLEPFELRTIQVQQDKALITICIDKRTETAVPCTSFYALP